MDCFASLDLSIYRKSSTRVDIDFPLSVSIPIVFISCNGSHDDDIIIDEDLSKLSLASLDTRATVGTIGLVSCVPHVDGTLVTGTLFVPHDGALFVSILSSFHKPDENFETECPSFQFDDTSLLVSDSFVTTHYDE